MGLDIAFNRKAATDAGLVITLERNGTDDTIRYAKLSQDDPEYIAWLERYDPVIQVPGTDLRVIDDGYQDAIIIRANKWGRVYEPMTQWLKANNINWTEG